MNNQNKTIEYDQFGIPIASHDTKNKEDIVTNKESQNKDYSVHNDVAISGFEDGVARRPYFHFIANILWIFKYDYQKVNRRVELFADGRDTKHSQNFIDKDYDEVLDIITSSLLKEFYKDPKEKEALDVKKLK